MAFASIRDERTGAGDEWVSGCVQMGMRQKAGLRNFQTSNKECKVF